MAGAQKLSDRIPSEGPGVFYTDEFMTMMEQHIPLLRSNPNTQLRPIEPSLALQYANDFYGLLLSLGIPFQYHWTVTRCNGYSGPMQFKGDVFTVIVPPFTEIDQLQQIFSSNSNLSIGSKIKTRPIARVLTFMPPD